MVNEVVGRRQPDGTDPNVMVSGDYLKITTPGTWFGFWMLRLPAVGQWDDGHHGVVNPNVHQIEEHEDGTITISPSIKVSYGLGDGSKEVWHGYLRRGVWTAA